MRLNRRHKILIGITALFIIVNVLLLFFDNEQHVQKTSHIKTWTETTVEDMYEFIDTQGVLDFATENHVYFDETLGEFDAFLVDEGQEVQSGEGLYTYTISDYYEAASQLESEAEKVEGEMAAIETAISKMTAFQISDSSDSQGMIDPYEEFADPTLEDEEQDEEQIVDSFIDAMTGAEDAGQAELIKEQYITEKEKELDQKVAEQGSIESQLSELMQTGDTVTVESPYQGVVTDLSENLDAPLLTIQSGGYIVKGELSEAEHLDVEPGLAVNIKMKESDETAEGEIEAVSQFPKEIKLTGSSIYPFHVSLSDDDEEEAGEDADENDESEDPEEEFDGFEDFDDFNGEFDDDDVNEDLNLDINETDDETNEEVTDEENNDTMLPGYHADVEIKTKESPEATVIQKDALDGLFIWQMTSSGKLIKAPIQPGIQMDDYVELLEGPEMGELIALGPEKRLVSNAPFITSLNMDQVPWGDLKTNRWLQDFLTGLLSR